MPAPQGSVVPAAIAVQPAPEPQAVPKLKKMHEEEKKKLTLKNIFKTSRCDGERTITVVRTDGI